MSVLGDPPCRKKRFRFIYSFLPLLVFFGLAIWRVAFLWRIRSPMENRKSSNSHKKGFFRLLEEQPSNSLLRIRYFLSTSLLEHSVRPIIQQYILSIEIYNITLHTKRTPAIFWLEFFLHFYSVKNSSTSVARTVTCPTNPASSAAVCE